MRVSNTRSRLLNRTCLARCLVSIFALSAPEVYAKSIAVKNCTNDKADSLRAAVGLADSGDTIDMSNLQHADEGCATSFISLTTGAIAVPQDTLTILGSDNFTVIVSGKYDSTHIESDRVFNHTGHGTLTLTGIDVTYGRLSSSTAEALGGCIYSAGDVTLNDVLVAGCRATGAAGGAAGGGIYAGSVNLMRSRVTGNVAEASGTGNATGGGIFANSGLTMMYSTVALNQSNGAPTSFGGVGGVLAGGTLVNVKSSTIYGNSTTGIYGGFYFDANAVDIVNTTIAQNTAANFGAGALASSNTTVENTTVAFNTSNKPNTTAGLHLYTTSPVKMYSTIVSNNATAGGVAADMESLGGVITGAKNLVYAGGNVTLPNDTLRGVCPRLAPLRNNGGPTSTLALQGGSPAIDHGEIAPAIFLITDQRGTGFPRLSGNQVDIGAYEVNANDVIFGSDFEGCPAAP